MEQYVTIKISGKPKDGDVLSYDSETDSYYPVSIPEIMRGFKDEVTESLKGIASKVVASEKAINDKVSEMDGKYAEFSRNQKTVNDSVISMVKEFTGQGE